MRAHRRRLARVGVAGAVLAVLGTAAASRLTSDGGRSPASASVAGGTVASTAAAGTTASGATGAGGTAGGSGTAPAPAGSTGPATAGAAAAGAAGAPATTPAPTAPGAAGRAARPATPGGGDPPDPGRQLRRGGLQLGLMDPTYQATQRARWAADVRALRPAVLRYDLHWSIVASTRPQRPADPADPAYDWSYMDVLLKGARELGVPAIVTLWRTPAWAARSPRHPAPTGVPQLAAWRSYVMAAATRYSGHHPDPAGGVLPRVSAWEIWNESNLSRYFSPQVGSPELYTELLNAAYDAIKAVGARHGYRQTVAGGSLYRSGASGVAPIPFLRGMRAANARFDVISVHPYNAVPGLGPREGEGDTTGNNVATGNFGRLIREADRLWPGRRPRFWVTEYGWKSWPDRVQGVAPDLQARFLRDGVRTFRALHPRVEVLVWFLLRDEPLRYPDGHAGWQTGLRYVDGRPKPSYAAFRELRG